jgi:4-hydroxy-4-methyl-2-oxoglutarate aldolase
MLVNSTMTPIKIAETLGQYPTATLYEAAGKRGDMSPVIRPIVPNSSIFGIAYTVKTFPSDSTAVIRALDQAPPASVLVIDSGGTNRAAVWGGTSSLVSSMRGLAGCITNGSVRDTDDIIKTGIPVYATGISPRGTLKNHEGWSNISVSVGGVSVSPGDFIIGDSDGVVVISKLDGEKICKKAKAQRENEVARDIRVQNGEKLADIIGLKTVE